MAAATEEEFELFPELQNIIDQREKNLISMGWPPDEALELAGMVYLDWHEADLLKQGGCPFHTILQILT